MRREGPGISMVIGAGMGRGGVLKTSRKRQPEECGVDRSRLYLSLGLAEERK